ncbi:MAG: nucleoside deaminase [Candidatus Brocadiia bacterium]
MELPEVTVSVPDWVTEASELERPLEGARDRMRLVIRLSRLNVEHGTGGPFAAAVFESDSGRLVSAGVNRVIASNCSSFHAELVALTLAQARLGSYDLSRPDLPACELVSSTDPCVMCIGAVLWSGVERLVCGASGEDAVAVGFDEGPKPADWPGELRRRGIEVVRGVLREEAASVLRFYVETGGEIYNASPRPEP